MESNTQHLLMDFSWNSFVSTLHTWILYDFLEVYVMCK